MTGKIVNINEFKARKQQKQLNLYLQDVERDFEYILKHGVCDACKCSDTTVRRFSDNISLCDGCVGI